MKEAISNNGTVTDDVAARDAQEQWEEQVRCARIPVDLKTKLLDAANQETANAVGDDETILNRDGYFRLGWCVGLHLEERVERSALMDFDWIYDRFMSNFTFSEIQKGLTENDMKPLHARIDAWLGTHMGELFDLVPSDKKEFFMIGFCEGIARNR